jgi:hypothetical protein
LCEEIWEIHVPFKKKGWQKFEWRNMGNSCAFKKKVGKSLSGEIWEIHVPFKKG